MRRNAEEALQRRTALRWTALALFAVALAAGIFAFELHHLPQASASYIIANSAQFATTSSDYLSETFSTSVSTSTWTVSMWVKRGALGTVQTLMSASTTADDRIVFTASDQLAVDIAGLSVATSTAVFRDPSAWLMCGRPRDCKSNFIGIGDWSGAVMCPACRCGTCRWP